MWPQVNKETKRRQHYCERNRMHLRRCCALARVFANPLEPITTSFDLRICMTFCFVFFFFSQTTCDGMPATIYKCINISAVTICTSVRCTLLLKQMKRFSQHSTRTSDKRAGGDIQLLGYGSVELHVALSFDRLYWFPHTQKPMCAAVMG